MEKIAQLGQDSQDRTTRAGQPGEGQPQPATVRTRHPGKDSRETSVRRGQPERFWTARIVQPGQNIRNSVRYHDDGSKKLNVCISLFSYMVYL
jgi:hypothetical protein